MKNLGDIVRGKKDSYPRKTRRAASGKLVEEKCKGSARGARHRVNPPGTGGVARKLLRKAARESRL